MTAVGQVLATVLWLYWVVLIGRLVFDLVQVFARTWRPSGFLLLVAEAIYTVTDPPLRLLRRIIPPIRIGSVQFDLAFLILLVGISTLINYVVPLIFF